MKNAICLIRGGTPHLNPLLKGERRNFKRVGLRSGIREVGTSRCDVRAAFSGAIARYFQRLVPPAAARAGTSQRDVPTVPPTFFPAVLFLTTFLFGFVAEAKLNVVATTPDLAALAQEIGGDKVEVTTLAKPTEDPHFIDAKPSFIVKLNRADALIEGGAELEVGWLPSLLEGARNAKIASGKPGRIACSEGVPLIEIPAALDRSKGDIHAAGNPHYMTDPENAKIVAEHIANSFCQIDSADCEVFKSNLQKCKGRLDAKLAEWQKLLAPHKGKIVVTYHNFWPYFAKRFDLKMDLFLEPKPGIPPTPAHLAQVIGKMKSEGVKVILVQPYQNPKTAEAVSGHTGAAVVNFPSFPSKPSDTYADWMDGLVTSLARALEGKK